MTSASEHPEGPRPQIPGTPAEQPGGSADPAEIARFERLAESWWDPEGQFRPLHRLNPTRIAYIRSRAAEHRGRDPKTETPLAGLRLLDIGCGGGLLCEPMARLGATVTGIDAGATNIAIARRHAAASGLDIDYRADTAENLAASGARFDIVLNMEVVEHVADVGLFLGACAALVAPGGILITATLNRTLKSFALAIVGAEYVLRWLPRGTHDWRRFLRPAELAARMRENGMAVLETTGVRYDPLGDRWSLSRDVDVNYMMLAVRPAG